MLIVQNIINCFNRLNSAIDISNIGTKISFWRSIICVPCYTLHIFSEKALVIKGVSEKCS